MVLGKLVTFFKDKKNTSIIRSLNHPFMRKMSVTIAVGTFSIIR